jgi:hypothetical protein
VPRSGNKVLGDDVGAYVPILALATSMKHFDEIVVDYLHKQNFDVIAIGDISQYSKRTQVHPRIKKLAENLSKECPIVTDYYQTYGVDAGDPVDY